MSKIHRRKNRNSCISITEKGSRVHIYNVASTQHSTWLGPRYHLRPLFAKFGRLRVLKKTNEADAIHAPFLYLY